MAVFGFDKSTALTLKRLAERSQSTPTNRLPPLGVAYDTTEAAGVQIPGRKLSNLRGYVVVPITTIPGAKRIRVGSTRTLRLGSGTANIWLRDQDTGTGLTLKLRRDDVGNPVSVPIFNLCPESIEPAGSSDSIEPEDPVLFVVQDQWGDLYVVETCTDSSSSSSTSTSYSASDASSYSSEGSISESASRSYLSSGSFGSSFSESLSISESASVPSESLSQVSESASDSGSQVSESGSQVSESGSQVSESGSQVSESLSQVSDSGSQVSESESQVSTSITPSTSVSGSVPSTSISGSVPSTSISGSPGTPSTSISGSPGSIPSTSLSVSTVSVSGVSTSEAGSTSLPSTSVECCEVDVVTDVTFDPVACEIDVTKTTISYQACGDHTCPEGA